MPMDHRQGPDEGGGDGQKRALSPTNTGAESRSAMGREGLKKREKILVGLLDTESESKQAAKKERFKTSTKRRGGRRLVTHDLNRRKRVWGVRLSRVWSIRQRKRKEEDGGVDQANKNRRKGPGGRLRGQREDVARSPSGEEKSASNRVSDINQLKEGGLKSTTRLPGRRIAGALDHQDCGE